MFLGLRPWFGTFSLPLPRNREVETTESHAISSMSRLLTWGIHPHTPDTPILLFDSQNHRIKQKNRRVSFVPEG